jgi:hypothetical protein
MTPVNAKRRIRLLAACLALGALSSAAGAQTTCFGGPAVMTCLDSANGSYQVSCYGGNRFRACFTPQGQSFTVSNTGGNNTNPSASASLQTPPSGAKMIPARPAAGPTAPCPTTAKCSGQTSPGATAPR